MSEIQGKPVYGVCACKEKVQVLSVDQVVDLIQQMAANDWQVPADYIPKTSVNGIVEQKSGDEIKLWIGKQAEYDALTDEEKAHKFAIITDDPTLNEITTLLNGYGQSIENINNNITKMINGDLQVGNAQNATNAVNAENGVKNADGTFSQLVRAGDGSLLMNTFEIIPTFFPIWSGNQNIKIADGITKNLVKIDLAGFDITGKKIKIIYSEYGDTAAERELILKPGSSTSYVVDAYFSTGSLMLKKIDVIFNSLGLLMGSYYEKSTGSSQTYTGFNIYVKSIFVVREGI